MVTYILDLHFEGVGQFGQFIQGLHLPGQYFKVRPTSPAEGLQDESKPQTDRRLVHLGPVEYNVRKYIFFVHAYGLHFIQFSIFPRKLKLFQFHLKSKMTKKILQNHHRIQGTHVICSTVVTGCNPNDLDIWTDWCRLGLQFVVYKSAKQEWSFVN